MWRAGMHHGHQRAGRWQGVKSCKSWSCKLQGARAHQKEAQAAATCAATPEFSLYSYLASATGNAPGKTTALGVPVRPACEVFAPCHPRTPGAPSQVLRNKRRWHWQVVETGPAAGNVGSAPETVLPHAASVAGTAASKWVGNRMLLMPSRPPDGWRMESVRTPDTLGALTEIPQSERLTPIMWPPRRAASAGKRRRPPPRR